MSTQNNNVPLPPGFSPGDGDRAYTRQVQDNERATHQLEQFLGSGSPYLANARKRGEEVAQARQLGNSSIAAGAAERSAIEAAAPLAAADADAFRQAAGENINALNNIKATGMNNASSERIAGMQAATARANLQAQLKHSGQQADLDRMHQMAMGELSHNLGLQRAAYEHGLDLDQMGANFFYEMQQFAALEDASMRQNGMIAGMQAFSNWQQGIQQALTGDYDVAAQNRLINAYNEGLTAELEFNRQLFNSAGSWDWNFEFYGSEGEGG